MIIKQKKRGRPQKRKNLIELRKARVFTDEKGITRTWTQKYVAQQIENQFGKKITASAIGQFERGQNNPSLTVLQMLAQLYGKSIDDLLS